MRLCASDLADMERMIVAAPNALHAARELMTAAAATYTGEATSRGCLLASAAANGSAAATDLQHAVVLKAACG